MRQRKRQASRVTQSAVIGPLPGAHCARDPKHQDLVAFLRHRYRLRSSADPAHTQERLGAGKPGVAGSSENFGARARAAGIGAATAAAGQMVMREGQVMPHWPHSRLGSDGAPPPAAGAAVGCGVRVGWAAAGAVLVLSAVPLQAQMPAADAGVANPPKFELRQGAPKSTLMAERPATGRTGGEKQLDLNIVYTDSTLYNPGTGRKDRVRLRSYAGASVDPDRPYVAPTVEVFPGDTVRITLNNKLPDDPGCVAGDNPNIPHCFNSTNLHTHGLWVSPAGNGDNVLLSINPGVSFQYEYNIPPDHPAGTFWYHPHRHGSTALQVSSGMAGALIVRGDRLPTAAANGDIDTLLVGRDGRPIRERVLVLQQIQYACLDAEGAIKVKRNEAGEVLKWVCDAGDVGGIEFYSDPGGNGLFGAGTWTQSGRYTSINGLVLPIFQSHAGQIERWRLIHAGVRDTIALEFREMKKDAATAEELEAAQADRFIGDNCTGKPLTYHVFASDGLTMAAVTPTTLTTLQPGYRSDALVLFPRAGKYCVINAAVPASASVSRAAVSRRLLGIVAVAPGTSVNDVNRYLQGELVTAARQAMPPAIRKRVVADLKDGLKLSRFVPLPDIADAEVTGRQVLTFYIDTAVSPASFQIDGQAYDPDRIDRLLTLGGVDEWTLQSHFAGHPFHIHVNPFQVVRIVDPGGRDVSVAGMVDDAGGTADPQYPGLKGVWKDTLWIKSLIPPANYPGGVYTAVIRTRYQRYIGDYVLHCHILDHEDQGMMQNVRIALPDGRGGTIARHH
jgi:FtsP/CotA-like multicopper oxidase with cupredoxin domain